MGMIRSCTRIFHLTALLLSYHSMNRITLLAERADMVIRLMQLWVPRSVRFLGTMGRNRWFCLKVGLCWLFLFLRYNSNILCGFLQGILLLSGLLVMGQPFRKGVWLSFERRNNLMVLGLAGFEPVSVFEWTALSFERLTHRTAYLPIVSFACGL